MHPYLFFEGRCEEAIQFYQEKLGAQVEFLMRFGESPDQTMQAPGLEQKIMHASLKIAGADLAMSDGSCSQPASFQGFALTLVPPDVSEADRLFAALADGGKIQMPLTETFFSPRFGMVADRFGVSWMIYVAK